MLPERFATLPLETRHQRDAWRAWFAPVFDVSPHIGSDNAFPAENVVWRVGPLAISRVMARAVTVRRTQQLVRQNPVDHWVLTFCNHGATRIQTSRGAIEAQPGVPFLWSLAEESVTERTEVARVQFFLSRDAFRDLAPALDAARGTVLATPLGELLGDYMLAVERRLPALGDADVPRLVSAVRAMVAASVSPSLERMQVANEQIEFGRMERVRRAVRSNIRSSRLTPKNLCRSVGMSRSQLYRLFEDSGGVARYIQRERLLASHAVLSDTRNTDTIAAIGESFCFPDASSFSRAFRREFGQSPSDVRALASLGCAPEPVPAAIDSAPAKDFARLLRGF